MRNNEKIDFVIPWVDGSDEKWQKDKNAYSGNIFSGNEAERYRDWEQLKYWFRGVERFAPWVNKIHFITYGHLPAWLNTEHPKLHIVYHKDYIPEEYLPTFSSHPIELNMHRIEGLSEQFVYFNDDMFITNTVSPDDFFIDGIPCGTAGLAVPGQVSPQFASIQYGNCCLINKNFSSKEVIKKHLLKFINIKYGLKRNLLTLLLLPYCTSFFPGFYTAHGPNAYLRSTLEDVWRACSDKLDATCHHRFRAFDDVSQSVFLWWQWCKGLICPQNGNMLLSYISVLYPDEQIRTALSEKATPLTVINDDWVDNFEQKKTVINSAFESILGNKSTFER